MRDYVISSDTTCDLPTDYCKTHDIDIHPLFYRFGEDDALYGGDSQLDPTEFYRRMRDGEMPTTVATNPEDSKTYFKKRIEEGKNILHISFSSALSSSFQNTALAASELMEEYPEAKILVIDSLCASLGEGLLVYLAMQQKEAGKSIDEVADYVRMTIPHLSHQFTVDDLNHLYRGGRVSKATAVVGSIINIKPLLHVNDLGQLIPIGKIRGRKKSLIALVDKMAESIGSQKNGVFMISHGDSIDDANFVADLVKERTGIKDCLINYICPTIGAHAGPGTIALFFLADHR